MPSDRRARAAGSLVRPQVGHGGGSMAEWVAAERVPPPGIVLTGAIRHSRVAQSGIGRTRRHPVSDGATPTELPASVEIDKPNAARIYDYMLGGSHNFEVDRKFAEDMMAAT